MTDNKQTVLTDEEITQTWCDHCNGIDKYNKFARAVESTVLSKLRGAGEPVRWLHTLRSEHDDPLQEKVTLSQNNPFGKPAVDYDPSYRVATEPLYAAPQASAPVADERTKWHTAQRIVELPSVDKALANFCDDGIQNNAVLLVQAILDAAPQASAEAVPHGWKVVPEQPTGDMLDAMLAPWLTGNRSEREALEAGYAGALHAAPAAAPVSDGKTRVVGEHLTGGCLNWDDGEESAGAAVSPLKRWPFVESPGEFTERLAAALKTLDGNLLPAVRHVLIEHPPTLADRQQRGGDDGEGLTPKRAWWAGYRAGKGLPPDTSRQEAASAYLRCPKCGERACVSISSAKLVTCWPDWTPRDERDIASDPEGKLIHDPAKALLAAQPAASAEPIQLSDDVRQYLKEGIDSATQGEDSDADTAFAHDLARLLDPIYAAPFAALAAHKPDGGDARDAIRYRGFRTAMVNENVEWLESIEDALVAMGCTPGIVPTAEKVDAAFDAALAAQQGKGEGGE